MTKCPVETRARSDSDHDYTVEKRLGRLNCRDAGKGSCVGFVQVGLPAGWMTVCCRLPYSPASSVTGSRLITKGGLFAFGDKHFSFLYFFLFRETKHLSKNMNPASK